MKVATFNVNSLRARLPIVLEWLEGQGPDILCLQETKVQDQDFPAGPLEEVGYRAAFRGQKSYNGVAILSKSPLERLRTELYPGGDEQARFISASAGGVPIINVYVPQGFAVGTDKFAYKLTWLRDLLSFIKGEYDPSGPLILAGDFNIALEPEDLFDPEQFKGEVAFHPDEQALLKEFLGWGFVDLFRKHVPEGGHYTFWDYRIPNGFKRNMGWRIDYLLATAPAAAACVDCWIDTGPRGLKKPSDHTLLVAQFDFEGLLPKSA